MSDPVADALALWGLGQAEWSFVAGRENRVYRVDTGSETFALRLKRPGYREPPELISELAWMAEMARAGLRVPAPKPSKRGTLLEQVDGHYVDLITWLDGRPLGQGREPLNVPDAPATFEALGREMAKLHLACDAWTPPPDFIRCRWDAEGLLGDAPLWGRFWENPTLDADTRELLEAFRARARRDLAVMDLDKGLIHADLVQENVLLDGDTLSLIDFDDGGHGYRLFDVATALLKNRKAPDFETLQSALIRGYQTARPLDMEALDLFLALRAVTYVGWIVPRMTEDGAQQRNTRFIQDARDLCGAYLETSKVT